MHVAVGCLISLVHSGGEILILGELLMEKRTGREPAKGSHWLVRMVEYTSTTAFTARSSGIPAPWWRARLRGFADSRLMGFSLGIVTLLVAGLSSVTTALVMGDIYIGLRLGCPC